MKTTHSLDYTVFSTFRSTGINQINISSLWAIQGSHHLKFAATDLGNRPEPTYFYPPTFNFQLSTNLQLALSSRNPAQNHHSQARRARKHLLSWYLTRKRGARPQRFIYMASLYGAIYSLWTSTVVLYLSRCRHLLLEVHFLIASTGHNFRGTDHNTTQNETTRVTPPTPTYFPHQQHLNLPRRRSTRRPRLTPPSLPPPAAKAPPRSRGSSRRRTRWGRCQRTTSWSTPGGPCPPPTLLARASVPPPAWGGRGGGTSTGVCTRGEARGFVRGRRLPLNKDRVDP